jgi:hypothetical protein
MCNNVEVFILAVETFFPLLIKYLIPESIAINVDFVQRLTLQHNFSETESHYFRQDVQRVSPSARLVPSYPLQVPVTHYKPQSTTKSLNHSLLVSITD